MTGTSHLRSARDWVIPNTFSDRTSFKLEHAVDCNHDARDMTETKDFEKAEQDLVNRQVTTTLCV